MSCGTNFPPPQKVEHKILQRVQYIFQVLQQILPVDIWIMVTTIKQKCCNKNQTDNFFQIARAVDRNVEGSLLEYYTTTMTEDITNLDSDVQVWGSKVSTPKSFISVAHVHQ